VVDLYNRRSPGSRKLQLVDPTGAATTGVADPARWSWDEDGLRSDNVPAFLTDPRFRNAYARGVKAGGFDYGISYRAHTLMWAAGLAEPIEGDFVECGTGRGFLASAICAYLDWTDRPFHLFDTFEQSDRYESALFYADGAEPVRENFREYPGVQLVVGRIPESLSTVQIERVAFLHVDLNQAEPEEAAVRHFWPLLSPGGVMVFDDYGFARYADSRASANRLADELGFEIYSPPSGQGLVIKRAAP
jgi:hypothetical protein